MNQKTANKQLIKTVVLIGMMGAGKSTLGRLLAKRLYVTFKDSDEEIEQTANMSIATIFEKHGEAYFRDRERQMIADLLDAPPMIMAIGGGAFMDSATRTKIKEKAVSVWLNVPLEKLVQRIQKQADRSGTDSPYNQRPLLKQTNPVQTFAKLLAQRQPIYAQADITIKHIADTPTVSDTQAKTINRIIAELSACAILV